MTDELKPEALVLGGRGHKPTCECKTCLRIREMHSRGQSKPAHKRRLGPGQVKKKAFVKAYTDPLSPTFGNQGKSAQSAGYSASTGSALLKDPQVQSIMRTALERHGSDDDYLALGLKEGLRAEEVKLATFEGKFTDQRRVPDFYARARFQDMTHRLRGDYPQDEPPQQSLLVIVLGAPLVPGHDHGCNCEKCVQAYNEDSERLNREQEVRLQQYSIDRGSTDE